MPQSTEFKRWPLWEREGNQELWDHYAANTMEPGWAGKLSTAQADYIRGVLTGAVKNPFHRRVTLLRRKWGFVEDGADVTEEAIQVVAISGDPDDPAFNAALVHEANRTPHESPRQLTLLIP